MENIPDVLGDAIMFGTNMWTFKEDNMYASDHSAKDKAALRPNFVIIGIKRPRSIHVLANSNTGPGNIRRCLDRWFHAYDGGVIRLNVDTLTVEKLTMQIAPYEWTKVEEGW